MYNIRCNRLFCQAKKCSICIELLIIVYREYLVFLYGVTAMDAPFDHSGQVGPSQIRTVPASHVSHLLALYYCDGEAGIENDPRPDDSCPQSKNLTHFKKGLA